MPLLSKLLSLYGLAAAFIVLYLPACGSDGTALGENPAINGHIENWNRVSGYSVFAQISSSQILASAPVNGDGTFSVSLPGSATMLPLLQKYAFSASQYDGAPGGCTSTVTANPTSAMYREISFRIGLDGKTTETIAQYHADTAAGSGTIAVYTFWDRDVVISGMVQGCTRAESNEIIALHYQPGWNFYITDYTKTGISYTSKPIPGEIAGWNIL